MNLKKELFLISGIFGIANIATLVFTFFYLFPAMRETSKELTLAELSLLLTNDEQSEQIEDTYKKMEQDYQKAGNLFANSITPLETIGFLEKIAREEDLVMKISPITIEKYKYDLWKFLGFEITLSGHFTNTQRFIERMENSKNLFEINNLVVKNNPTNQKLDETITTILLKIYTNHDK